MDKRYKHLNGEERAVILAEHRRAASLQAIGLLLGQVRLPRHFAEHLRLPC